MKEIRGTATDKYIAQYKYRNCVYFLNAETGKIQKICDIEAARDLPPDVRNYFDSVSRMLNESLGRQEE
jgi:hypothetical protein